MTTAAFSLIGLRVAEPTAVAGRLLLRAAAAHSARRRAPRCVLGRDAHYINKGRCRLISDDVDASPQLLRCGWRAEGTIFCQREIAIADEECSPHDVIFVAPPPPPSLTPRSISPMRLYASGASVSFNNTYRVY